MTNRIEVDMSVKYLSRSLDISEEVVYAELKNVKLPPKTQEEVSRPSLDVGQLLIGYCSAYQLYDLFLKSIDYTDAHFEGVPSYDFVRRELDIYHGKSERTDPDAIKALELLIESENE